MAAVEHRPDRRLALSIDEAARVLSLSRDSFERHVMGEIRVLRVGRRLLVPVRELEKWIDRASSIPLVAELSSRRQGGRPVTRQGAL
jgi:excisionase family DNA binding protein